jgi:class 3 adenylate cyclase
MKHRGAACLYADVSGYCRLINADVRSTVRTLTAYRALMTGLVAKHAGRVVDTAGDSFLAEFGNISRAVRCGLDLQAELSRHNAGLPPSQRVEFRIGIDLGDVLVHDGRIYGNCVNTAARVQSIAAPGSVCIAASAYERMDAALPVQFEYLGEHAVRNIDEPLRIYRVE